MKKILIILLAVVLQSCTGEIYDEKSKVISVRESRNPSYYYVLLIQGDLFDSYIHTNKKYNPGDTIQLSH